MMWIAWAVLLVIVVLVGWGSNLFGIPGNWINAAAVLIYTFFMPTDLRVSIGWGIVAGVFALAVLGEIVEFAAGAAGAKKAGGSRRSAVLALVGGLIGALLGTFAGVIIPIPVVGSIIGALLFAGLGSLGGAVLGETWAGRNADHSWRVGVAAFWGRILGTVGKILVGSMIVGLVLAAIVLK